MRSTRPPLKQETPAELVNDVLASIREIYWRGQNDKHWFEMVPKLRDWCVLWPAKFIAKEKHFTVPADRFKQILTNVLCDAKRHQAGRISYLPAFLGKCVQEHFRKHWEEYYEESKSLVVKTEAALLALKKLPVAPDRTVEQLAQVADVLIGRKRKQKLAKPADQLNLFRA